MFKPDQHLGSFSQGKQVLPYLVLDEKKFGLIQSLTKRSLALFSLGRKQVWTLDLGDKIYEMRCLFVAVGPNALFIVLPH